VSATLLQIGSAPLSPERLAYGGALVLAVNAGRSKPRPLKVRVL
jgi:hypothetical protein